MVANQKVTGKAMSMPGGIAISVFISITVTVILCWFLAWLIISGRAGESAVGYGAMGILVLSSYMGAMIAAVKIKRRRMVTCLLCGAAYFVCLLACTALFFGGQYSGVGVSGILIALGSAAAALSDIRKKREHNKIGRQKIRSR